MHVLKRALLLFLARATIPVAITSPACGGTLTNAAVTVIWNFSPGTQYSYRLRVYSDAALTTLAYDSGIVVSSTLSASIPFGILSTARTYYATVDVVLTDGTEGASSACAWTTSFATSAAVVGVALHAIGACSGDHTELPGVRLSWTVIVPSGTETFIEYDIKRREAGETDWQRIAIVTTRTTHEIYDYTIMPGTSYQYAVTWTALSGPSVLASAEQSPPVGIYPEWDHTFIHDVADPTQYVRLDSWKIDEQEVQDVQFLQLAGRQGATAQIGEREGKRWRVSGLTRALNSPRNDLWADLMNLITRQRTMGSVLCARSGVMRSGMFCQGSVQRSIDTRSFDPSADFTEVYYDFTV